jgi:hypothetical protein
MLANGASRADVARALMASLEGSQYRVEQDYEWLLHRAADANGMAAYSAQLVQQGQDEPIIVTLLGSDEFYARR